MRVLFTHGYVLRLDPKQWKAARPYPPLATLYAVAAARAHGHETELFDATFSDGASALSGTIDRFRPDALVIWDDSFNWQTKMCLGVMEREALAMVRLARRRVGRVIVYGSDATDHRPRFLDAGADAVLLGDAEATLCELLAAWEMGRSLDGIVGVARMEGGRLVESGRRRSPNDLDTLATPAWDALDLRPYESMWRARHGHWSLNLVSSRGCPYGCTWCAKPLFGRQYLVHSPQRMADDLAALRARASFDEAWFCDDIFGLTGEWTGAFADAVLARDVRMPFMIQTRSDLVVQPELRRGLVRAGLRTAWLGAESGSQQVLDAMNKGLRVEQTYEAVRRLREDGVRVGLFLQFGYLGETRADIDATQRMVADLLPDEIGVSISYPLPGTPFHQQVQAALGDKTNWQDSDDLELMHPGSYSAAFYRRLHRYTHHAFQAQRGMAALHALAAAPRRATTSAVRRAALTAYFGPIAAFDAWQLERLQREQRPAG